VKEFSCKETKPKVLQKACYKVACPAEWVPSPWGKVKEVFGVVFTKLTTCFQNLKRIAVIMSTQFILKICYYTLANIHIDQARLGVWFIKTEMHCKNLHDSMLTYQFSPD